MKKKIEGKLALNRETLRSLGLREMADVAGGVTVACAPSYPDPTCATCAGRSCLISC
jgi:hypothetical protein